MKKRSPYLAVDRFARLNLVWQLLGVFVIIVLLMGTVALIGGITDPYDWFLIGANPGDPGTIGGRITAVILYALFSIGFTGLFVMYILNWMDRRKDRWECGSTRYNIASDFALVIGGHSMTPRLCAKLLADSANRYVVVTTEGDVDMLRRRIYSELPDRMHSRLIVYHASQTSDFDLRELYADKANAVYIFGDDGKPSPDADNVDTYRRLIALSAEDSAPSGIPCHVMLSGISSGRVFYASDVESRGSSPFDFRPFFYCDEWARRILAGDGKMYAGVASGEVLSPESGGRIHIVILGITDMSLAVMRQAAQLLHLPGYVAHRSHPVTKITVIDRDMRRWLPRLKSYRPELFGSLKWERLNDTTEYAPAVKGFTDMEWMMVEADPDHDLSHKVITDLVTVDDTDAVTLVVSSPDGDYASVATAFNLPHGIYAAGCVRQVLVEQNGSPSLIAEVAKGIRWKDHDGGDRFTPSRFAKVRPFGMLAQCDHVSDFDSAGPKIMAYIYQNADTDPGLEQLLQMAENGDFSALDKAWQAISTDGGKSAMSQRMSNIYSAASIPFKAGWLDAGMRDNLTPDEVELLAEVEHNRWNMEQLMAGYRPMTSSEAEALSNGTLSRAELKSRFVHPDIVPYGQLSESSKNYDRAMVRCIPNFLKICRLYDKR